MRERRLIAVSLAAGMTQEQVATVAGISLTTLKTACKKELAEGGASVNAKVAGKLFTKCMKGDTIALIYWTKTRMGWRENNKLEVTGKDGGPIQHEQVQAEADAFTARIASMADRFAAVMAAPDEKPAANDGAAANSTEAVGE
jgi:DNA-binding XRE family transcriptional regulator